MAKRDRSFEEKVQQVKRNVQEEMKALYGDKVFEQVDAWDLYHRDVTEKLGNIINLDVQARKDFRIGQKSPFPQWDPSHAEQYSQPITIFDTEVGGWSKVTGEREVLALGAVKVAYNNITRRFETIDTYERYYKPQDTSSKAYREALAVHELTPQILHDARRTQRRKQGLKYSSVYDAEELKAFREFVEGSVVAGHNIDKADIPWAFGNYLPGLSTIDTLTALTNMRGKGGNKLDQVFKDVTGMTMEQAGFGHHNAMSDTYATAIVLQALLNQRNETGQSLQFILQHPERTLHMAPTDTPDIYGPSQVTEGIYKGYMKGLEYYISREKLPMKFMQEGYGDLVDPSTGKLKEGYHVESGNDMQGWDLYSFGEEQGIPRMQKPQDSWRLTAALQQLKDTQKLLSQSMRDLAGSLETSSVSARPGKIRLLSKLVGDRGLENAPQAWKDAAQVLGIVPQDWGKYYQTSYDYAVTQYGHKDKIQAEREEKAKWYAASEEAYQAGRIAKGQYKKVLGSSDIKQTLDEAIESTDAWVEALKRFNDVPVFNPDRLFDAFEGGMGHALSQAKGILPKTLLDPVGRFSDMIAQNNRYNYAPFKAADNILNVLPVTAGGVGMTLGGPIGAGIAMGVTGAAKLGTQLWGNVKEAQIKRQWNMTSTGLDILGISVDLITMPFKALARATGLLTRGFNLLTGSVGRMASLGNPLTNLTGINYSHYQGLDIAAGMIGLPKGSLNTASEDFARQSRLLYTTGQFDTNRLKAASMLGVFSEVYGPNASFESTVNTLMKRGPITESVLALASQVNPHLAQTLQVMSDLGVTNIKSLEHPTSVYFNPLSSRERKQMRIAAYEHNAISMSMDNSFKRIGNRIWNAGGKTFADTINRALAGFAEGGSLSEAWGGIKGAFGAFKDSEIWKDIKEGLSGVWSDALPKLLKVVDVFVDAWLNGVGKVLNSLVDPITNLLNYVRNIKINWDPIHGVTFGKRWDPSQQQAGSVWSRFVGVTAEGVPNYMMTTHTAGRASAEDELKSWQYLYDKGLTSGVYDKKTGRYYTMDEFKKMMSVDPDNYISPESVTKTVFNTINEAKQVAHQVTGMAPEVLAAVGESMAQMTQEVITTVRLEVIDDKGRTQRVEGEGAKAVFNNMQATVQSISQRRR